MSEKIVTERPLIGEEPEGAEAVSRVLHFETLYRENFHRVWRSARALGVPESGLDDVCQEVFITVHRKIATYSGTSTPAAWIQGFVVNIARRAIRGHLRKSPLARASKDPGVLEEVVSGTRAPEESALANERRQQGLALLNEMPAEHREVFVLVELEEMSVVEAADALSINLNTAYSRLRLGREHFRARALRLRASRKEQ